MPYGLRVRLICVNIEPIIANESVIFCTIDVDWATAPSLPKSPSRRIDSTAFTQCRWHNQPPKTRAQRKGYGSVVLRLRGFELAYKFKTARQTIMRIREAVAILPKSLLRSSSLSCATPNPSCSLPRRISRLPVNCLLTSWVGLSSDS